MPTTNGPSRPHQPVNWQDATAATIERLQQIFSILPATFPWEQKIALYERTHAIVCSQGRTSGATEYWGTFVNTLRMLVAGLTDVDPKTLFD